MDERRAATAAWRTREALRRMRRLAGGAEGGGLALLRQRVDELERQVTELRSRQFSLLFAVVGGVAVSLAVRLLGL